MALLHSQRPVSLWKHLRVSVPTNFFDLAARRFGVSFHQVEFICGPITLMHCSRDAGLALFTSNQYLFALGTGRKDHDQISSIFFKSTPQPVPPPRSFQAPVARKHYSLVSLTAKKKQAASPSHKSPSTAPLRRGHRRLRRSSCSIASPPRKKATIACSVSGSVVIHVGSRRPRN